MGDVSIGSTGGLHESRNLHTYLIYLLGFYSQLIFLIAGSEVRKLFLDFLIVKVEPQLMDKPRQYFIVEIIEVKHDNKTLISAFKQVAKYLQCTYLHLLHDLSLCAHLVMGENVYQVWMGDGEVAVDFSYPCLPPSTNSQSTFVAELSVTGINL